MGELLNANKWREKERRRNVNDAVSAIAAMLVFLLAAVFVIAYYAS